MHRRIKNSGSRLTQQQEMVRLMAYIVSRKVYEEESR